MQVHTTEALDISAQTAVNLKNAMAARSSAVILKNEDANAGIALVSVTNVRITQNAFLISTTTMLQKPMKNTYTPSVIREKV